MRVSFLNLGTISYLEGLAAQQAYYQQVANDNNIGFILGLEHRPVITLGKNSSTAHLLFDPSSSDTSSFDFAHTDRGGEATAHMPGQLVVYFVLPMRQLGFTVKEFIHCLEQIVLDLLKDKYGIALADRDPKFPGIWVEQKKICAIGIRIQNRISSHGIALNINNSLELFAKIIPCGIHGRSVTRLADEISRRVTTSLVWADFVNLAKKHLRHKHSTGTLLFNDDFSISGGACNTKQLSL